MPVAEQLEHENTDPYHLSAAAMREVLRERVRSIYGLSLDEFFARRRDGTLPEVPRAALIEVLVGERSREDERGG
jgi:hypothetical protein